MDFQRWIALISLLTASLGSSCKAECPCNCSVSLINYDRGSNYLSFYWYLEPEADSFCNFTEYKLVAKRVDDDSTPITRDTSPGLPSYYNSFYSLRPFTYYIVRVAGETADGFSVYFNTEVIARTREGIPAAPPNLEVHPSPRSALVTWDPPPVENWSGNVTRYKIYSNSTSLPFTTACDNNYTLTSLTPQRTYYVNVATVANDGVESSTSKMTFTTTTPDEYPGGLEVKSTTNNSLVISWNALDWCDQQYDVKVNKISEAGSLTHVKTYQECCPFNVSGLSPFTYYSVTVAARCNGPGVVSPAVVAQTDEDVPAAAPLNLRVLPSIRWAMVTWDPPSLQDQRGVITRYLINNDGTIFYTQNTYYNISPLDPFTKYNVTVEARTSAGYGPLASDYYMTMEDKPSTSPSDLRETAATSHSISVAWNPVSQDNGIITGYTIQVQQVFPSPGEPYSIVTDTSSTYAITGLQPNSTYRVGVAAHTSAGAGDYSLSVDVQTAEKEPLPPRLESVRRTSATQLEVAVGSLTAEESRGVISSYCVRVVEADRGGSLEGCLDPQTQGTIHSERCDKNKVFLVEDLAPSKRYCVSAAAVNGAGTGEYSPSFAVDLFSNQPCKMYLYGEDTEQVCSQLTKKSVMAFAEEIAFMLETECTCSFETSYLADPELNCREDVDKTFVLVFTGRLVATETTNATQLLQYFEDLLERKPVVLIGEAEYKASESRISSESYTTVIVFAILAVVLAILMFLILVLLLFLCKKSKFKGKGDISVASNDQHCKGNTKVAGVGLLDKELDEKPTNAAGKVDYPPTLQRVSQGELLQARGSVVTKMDKKVLSPVQCSSVVDGDTDEETDEKGKSSTYVLGDKVDYRDEQKTAAPSRHVVARAKRDKRGKPGNESEFGEGKKVKSSRTVVSHASDGSSSVPHADKNGPSKMDKKSSSSVLRGLKKVVSGGRNTNPVSFARYRAGDLDEDQEATSIDTRPKTDKNGNGSSSSSYALHDRNELGKRGGGNLDDGEEEEDVQPQLPERLYLDDPDLEYMEYPPPIPRRGYNNNDVAVVQPADINSSPVYQPLVPFRRYEVDPAQGQDVTGTGGGGADYMSLSAARDRAMPPATSMH